MAIVTFRFDGALPPRDEVEERLRELLGPRLFGAVDEIELSPPSEHEAAAEIWITSQDLVALAYARRVLSELGGRRIRLSGGEEMELQLPTWSERPWPSYGWLERLRTRLGPHSL